MKQPHGLERFFTNFLSNICALKSVTTEEILSSLSVTDENFKHERDGPSNSLNSLSATSSFIKNYFTTDGQKLSVPLDVFLIYRTHCAFCLELYVHLKMKNESKEHLNYCSNAASIVNMKMIKYVEAGDRRNELFPWSFLQFKSTEESTWQVPDFLLFALTPTKTSEIGKLWERDSSKILGTKEKYPPIHDALSARITIQYDKAVNKVKFTLHSNVDPRKPAYYVPWLKSLEG